MAKSGKYFGVVFFNNLVFGSRFSYHGKFQKIGVLGLYIQLFSRGFYSVAERWGSTSEGQTGKHGPVSMRIHSRSLDMYGLNFGGI